MGEHDWVLVLDGRAICWRDGCDAEKLRDHSLMAVLYRSNFHEEWTTSEPPCVGNTWLDCSECRALSKSPGPPPRRCPVHTEHGHG